jgi:hypothetical protein
MSVEDEWKVNMEHWWKQTILQEGKTELVGEKAIPILHLPPQITNGLGYDQIRTPRLQTAK